MALPVNVTRWRGIVDKWCVELKVSQSLVLAVIHQESGGNANAKRHEPEYEKRYIKGVWADRCRELGITSAEAATSYGLMQLMFPTAYGYGCRSIDQALDPDQNIRFGTAHLATLIQKHGDMRRAVAAYNGTGPAADRYAASVMALYERYKAEREGKPVNYFADAEFACKCGCGFCAPDPRLIATLNIIRVALGRPVIVTSGCRCKAHNAKVGGVANSNHTTGCAADIQCTGQPAVSVWGAILRLYREGRLTGLAGLGIYDNFVHVDVEPRTPGRLRQWDERTKK